MSGIDFLPDLLVGGAPVAARHCSAARQYGWVDALPRALLLCHDQAMLHPRFVRSLAIDPQQHPRGQAHLSSASGLAQTHGLFYLVADDEHHLARLDLTGGPDGQAPISLLRLFEGELPLRKGQRKDAKPDLETLAALPPLAGCPHGALLALGSGSRPKRERAVLVALDLHGLPIGRVAQVDLSALYAPLKEQFSDLNIEGAFVASGELRLLQRGNRSDARNACISFDWNQVAPWLVGRRSAAPAPKSVLWIELGTVGGVPLGLTDGAALPGGAWVFSAVAEDTHSSYADGACCASAIGLIGPDGATLELHLLQGAPKVEGIAVQSQGDGWMLTMVTDADDPDVPSMVLQLLAPWPHPYVTGAKDLRQCGATR
jgi:hypothetical protein